MTGLETELNVAVKVTGVAVVTAAAVAMNDPVDNPEATVTEDGTVRLALLDDNDTSVALVAVALSVTVQLSVPAPVIVDSAHPTAVSDGGVTTAGSTVIVVLAVFPAKDAVIFAVVALVTALPVAVNEPTDAPAGTVTLDGTLRLLLELDKVTTVAEVAAPLRLT